MSELTGSTPTPRGNRSLLKGSILLPEVAQKFGREFARQRGQRVALVIAQVQGLFTPRQGVERAAADPALPPSPARVTRVQIEPTRFNVGDHLWAGTLGLLAGLGEMLDD